MEPFGTDQQTLYPLVDIAHDDAPTLYPNVDYACLRKYGEKNAHFSMALVLESRDGEADRAVGYTCIYRYGSHRVQLECDIATRCWKIIPEELSSILLDDLHPLTLADQILTIMRRLDQQFFDLERHQLQNQAATPRLGRDEQIELKSLTIHEDEEHHKLSKDAVDYGLQSLMTSNRSKFSALAPPPVAPRRSRQNSACSTQSSVRYAVFIPPTPSAPIRRRRVVQSIVLHVERKKRSFEKIVDAIRGKERVTMNDLGLEFLRVYDGRFNYREGHTFVMPFRKKTWFLTIDKIIYVECMAGEMGPRSVLVLNYKSQYTSVHV